MAIEVPGSCLPLTSLGPGSASTGAMSLRDALVSVFLTRILPLLGPGFWWGGPHLGPLWGGVDGDLFLSLPLIGPGFRCEGASLVGPWMFLGGAGPRLGHPFEIVVARKSQLSSKPLLKQHPGYSP